MPLQVSALRPSPSGSSSASLFHTRAWVLWLLAALAPPVLTRNPYYLAIALAAVAAVYLVLSRRGAALAGWGALLSFGLALAAFAALFPPLFVKTGETTLFTLPGVAWEIPLPGESPPAVIEIGGRVSLESVVFGLVTGLALMALLVTFATFNGGVDRYLLLRGMPRFLYQSAVVLSIAVAFVPQMVAAQREIREAQALRGRRFRGIADLVPLFVALLAEGLERSMALAEAMEARGFGHGPGGSGGGSRLVRSAIAGSLLTLVGGAFLRTSFPERTWGTAAMALGAAGLAAAVWAAGRRVRRSRYRRQRWHRRDTVVAAASVAVLAAFAGIWALGREALAFYPYPRWVPPPFHPLLAASLLLLAVPALAAAAVPEERP